MSDNRKTAPPFGVPARPLVLSIAAAVAVLLVGCGLLALVDLPAGRGRETAVAGGVGGLLAIAVCAVSIFAFAPWKPRPALAWQTIWLGSTLIRLTVTPLLLASVYFVALLPGGAIFLGGVAGYGLALLAESLVLSRAAWSASPRPAEPPFDGPE